MNRKKALKKCPEAASTVACAAAGSTHIDLEYGRLSRNRSRFVLKSRNDCPIQKTQRSSIIIAIKKSKQQICCAVVGDIYLNSFKSSG
jgi:hypothetical protein